MVRSDNSSHPFRFRVELSMLKHTPNEDCRLVLANVQTHEAVAWMTQRALVEAEVESEERGSTATKQKRENLWVLHSLPPQIDPDLAGAHVPGS
jgi:hypothetical protein